MARDDLFKPDYVTVADGGTATFDGSVAGTGAAIINEIAGNRDAEIRIQESTDGGSTWVTIAQLDDENGNTTFTADWHTQFNRIAVKQNTRRIEITNVDGNGNSGEFSVSGDER